MILVSLCLSDIPKDKIKIANNGKAYINLVLSERKEKGQFGETHTLTISKTKEEREANVPTIYVGNGKSFDNKPVQAVSYEEIENMPSYNSGNTVINDLPF
jgi:hypothetical protein